MAEIFLIVMSVFLVLNHPECGPGKTAALTLKNSGWVCVQVDKPADTIKKAD